MSAKQSRTVAGEELSMYTRQELEARRAAVRQIERREGGVLVGVAVGLGVAQLLFLRWADVQLEYAPRAAVAGTVFLAYMGLLGWMLWRQERKLRAARPVCPQCGARLKGLSERVAVATGRCDVCGGQVVSHFDSTTGSTQPREY